MGTAREKIVAEIVLGAQHDVRNAVAKAQLALNVRDVSHEHLARGDGQ